MIPVVTQKTSFKWKIDDVLDLENAVSRTFLCDNIPMKLIATVEDINGEKILCFKFKFYATNRAEKNWICEVDAEAKIECLSKLKKNQILASKSAKEYCTSSHHCLIKYSLEELERNKMIDANGDLKAKFRCALRYYNFKKSDARFSNIKIMVQGTKFVVSKDVMVLNCRKFPSVFYSDDEEGRKFVFNDLEPEEFVYVLVSFDPTFDGVCDSNLKKYLKLDRRLDIPALHMKCEQHLMKNETMGFLGKMKLAEKFNLRTLMENSIDSLRTLKEVKAVHQNEKFNDLTAETRLMILEKYKDVV